MWEQNESDPFFFNDAGNNPKSIGETLSMRHAGVASHLILRSLARGIYRVEPSWALLAAPL